MKFDQLIHFLETAKHQHMGKAASILRTSASGISYSIDCLEADLGVELFLRRGKRLQLTEAGRRLMAKIPDIQKNLAQMRAFVTDNVEKSFQGHCRIAASHLLAENYLAPKAAKLFKDSPLVTLELLSLRSNEVLRQVLDGHLDLGICFSPQPHPELEMRILNTGKLKIYVHKKHEVLKHKQPLNHLNGYTAILPKALGGIDVCESHPVFNKHQVKPNIQFAFDDYGVATALVKHTQSWGFFVDFIEQLPDYSLKSIALPSSWNAQYNISVIWRKNHFLNSAMTSLIDALSTLTEMQK